MKNWWIWALIAVVVLLVGNGVSYYNTLIVSEENLKSLQAQVDNMYDRRVDLIPQLAAVVKRYVEYEKSTLVEVTKLRSDSANLTQLQDMVAKGQARSSDFSNLLSSTMASLKISVEAYPNLKGNEQFTNLFTNIEGSENRIRVAIKDYNDAIISYNLSVRSFPRGKLISSLTGFKEKERILPPESKDIKTVPNVDALLDSSK